ncbi:MAG: quinoprotein dehydrogenase-associated putative ABC transporter substrate-binding protein [Gammaproteobacteria bacterium]|nr:quinoprotein dehydrogenase-associated putative ABC transporter substrate-binding protein [Gammaproteobacteria bacterium]
MTEFVCRWMFRTLGVALALAMTATLLGAPVASSAEERQAFKVCADPYNLPFSNQEHQGFENKIAELFAKELNLPVEYTFFPQRLGFIRNTLRAEVKTDEYKCDVVMGVPDGFELAATTKPYYTSTWVMVYVKGRGLDDVKTPEDLANLSPERKSQVKVGLFDQGPAQFWVFKNGLMEQMVPYKAMSGDPKENPGKIIQDLVDGKIDVTCVWGPIAGYYAKQLRPEQIVLIPMPSDPNDLDMRFEYNISMGVRHGDRAWKEQLNGLIDKNKDQIREILEGYGVPLVEK